MVFSINLPRCPIAQIWRSENAQESSKAARLQQLFDSGQSELYESTRREMERAGDKFRLSLGKVYQIYDSDETMVVPIMFQVKEGTATWYFKAPIDVTHQEFRDEVYQAAAVGHLNVVGHCEKYWRGSNSLHVKKMHTHENESTMNHNHYRLEADAEFGPWTIFQHLFGFVKAQQEMGLFEYSSGVRREKFLTAEEAYDICHQYNVFSAKKFHQGPAKVVEIGSGDAIQKVNLPNREESLASLYKKKPGQVMTPEDMREWQENRHKEEPCREINPLMPLPVKLEAVKSGMRGLGSELAQTRQMANSKLAVLATVVNRDDNVPKASGVGAGEGAVLAG